MLSAYSSLQYVYQYSLGTRWIWRSKANLLALYYQLMLSGITLLNLIYKSLVAYTNIQLLSCLPGALLDLILLMPCLLSFCQFRKHFTSHLGSNYFLSFFIQSTFPILRSEGLLHIPFLNVSTFYLDGILLEVMVDPFIAYRLFSDLCRIVCKCSYVL